MPVCKRCGNQFPNRLEIDGKERVLNNRKFCLTCSPFGQNNRFDLTKRNICSPNEKFCTKCKQVLHRELFHKNGKGKRSICKKCANQNSVYREQQRKKEIVEYKGGKCEKCGYNKCIDALELHHHDPNTKDSSIRFKRHSWEKVKSEIDKCDLLCVNCHREVHVEWNKIKNMRP